MAARAIRGRARALWPGTSRARPSWTLRPTSRAPPGAVEDDIRCRGRMTSRAPPEQAGIGGRHARVAYDQGMNGGAARLWWLLRHFGHDDVAVLAGGLDDGSARSARARSGSSPPSSLRPREDDVVSAEEIQGRLGTPNFLLVDARAAERYRGEVEPIDPVAGHIPGAVNMPYRRAVVRRSRRRGGRLCGSGITAAVTVLADRAGIEAKLYPRLVERVVEPGLEVERG